MVCGEIFAEGAALRPRTPVRQATLSTAPKTLTDSMKNIHGSDVVRCPMLVVGLSL
jgi:hypothetical protein